MLAGIELVLFHQTPHGRIRRPCSLPSSGGPALGGTFGADAALAGGTRGRSCPPRRVPVVDHGEQLAARHDRASSSRGSRAPRRLRAPALRARPCRSRGRRDFHRARCIPGLLVPGDERRIGDRLGELRNADFGAHRAPSDRGQRGWWRGLTGARGRLGGAGRCRRSCARHDGGSRVSRAPIPRWSSNAAPQRRVPAARARGSCDAGGRRRRRSAPGVQERAPPSRSCRRWRIWYQAPWFCGSS